jgi:hypothetical protein
MVWSAAISWIVLRPLIASMAPLALNSGLWVRRLLNSFGEGCDYDGSLFQGPYPTSDVNDGACPKARLPQAALPLEWALLECVELIQILGCGTIRHAPYVRD